MNAGPDHVKGRDRSGSGARGHGRRRLTVLHVEDSDANRDVVERMLVRRRAVNVVGAADGASALELARECKPDLVLLDLNLPDMPGERLLRRLRDDAATARSRIVVVSADAAAQSAPLLAAGANGCLSKPVEIATLVAEVDACSATCTDQRDTVTSARSAGGAVVDERTLAALAELDDASGLTLAQRALAEARSDLRRLKAAREADERRALAAAAHGIRSSALLLGAARLAAAAADAEEAAAGDHGVPAELAARLETEIAAVRSALQRRDANRSP